MGGTRSIIAEPHGDSIRGRYVHWSGQPMFMGRALWALVARDGVDTARQRLLHDRYGWSSIDPTQADEPLGPGYNDGRFAVEVGYGVAYTTHGDQSSEDEWYTDPGDKGGAEWVYVLGNAALMVGNVSWEDGSVTWRGTFPYGGPEPEWTAIEAEVYESA